MVGVLAEHGVDALNQGERLLLRRPRCEPAHSRALAFGSAEQERVVAHDATSSSARRGRNGRGVTLTGLARWLAGHGQGGPARPPPLSPWHSRPPRASPGTPPGPRWPALAAHPTSP